MDWELEVDGKRRAVRDTALLEAELRTPEVQSAGSVVVERVLRRQVPRWEKMIYRLLGLRCPESEARGTIEVSLSGEQALVVFIKNDDDDGVIGTRASHASGLIEFSTPAGERFTESASQCISREAAFSAMGAFVRTQKRPEELIWKRVKAQR